MTQLTDLNRVNDLLLTTLWDVTLQPRQAGNLGQDSADI
jgi:hypothetical protein